MTHVTPRVSSSPTNHAGCDPPHLIGASVDCKNVHSDNVGKATVKTLLFMVQIPNLRSWLILINPILRQSGISDDSVVLLMQPADVIHKFQLVELIHSAVCQPFFRNKMGRLVKAVLYYEYTR